MNRVEILKIERDKIFTQLQKDNDNRVKWLTALMDIDDEMEELERSKLKAN